MDSSLPPAEELVLVDRELARLDARRAQLLLRRDWLLRVIGSQVPALGSAHPSVAPRPAAVPPRAEATPRSTQNVLLTLGGVLLTVAALVFTLVSWGTMGIGGRAAVLAVVTSGALGAPALLLRRGLASTAEAVAALGLVLTVLDAYALHRVALADTGGLAYTAAASAVLAGMWAGYGSALSRLRLPVPAAVVAAQLPLPLGVLAAGGGVLPVAWAALATAVLDLVLVLFTTPLAPRVAAGAGAAGLGGWAFLTGLALSLSSPLRGALLLLACAGVLGYLAVRQPRSGLASATGAGLAGIAAVGGLLRAVAPEAWIMPGYALCAVLLAGAAWRLLAGVPALRNGFALAGAGVLGLAVAWALPPVVVGVVGPLARTTDVWSGAHAERALSGYPATSLLVLLLAAGALAAVPRRWGRWGAVAVGWALLVGLPVSLDLPYGATLAVQLVATATGLALSVRPGVLTRGLTGPEVSEASEASKAPEAGEASVASEASAASATSQASEAPAQGVSGPWPGWAPRVGAPVSRTAEPEAVVAWLGLGCGLAAALSAVALGLDTRVATFTVLGVLAVLLGGVAAYGAGAQRLVGASAAVLAVAGLVGAGAAAGDAGAAVSGLVLLAVPAGTAAVGARLRRHPVAVAVEATGAAVGLCGLGLGAAAGRPALLALGLGLAGVIASATALRAERRTVAGATAVVLFVLAAWVRLAVWSVVAPEAYALPVTIPALAVGVLRRRRDPEASSWTAYGPGLAVTLVPSLFAAWTDAHWLRPLLLGLAALAVTLLGARFRLQALLVLGGAVLVLDGLHELAPYVVQVVGALPRWLPPALAGLLLLAVGATYEQRLREARRLRERLGRMR
ncbi:SCO7613 C-terminal domain-containing membrane protein [Streptomyces sp. NPDC101160]|uniref:SCO7613 C-terminal domain-containing membrane protein n=1 Tax=Streptomyces sp. NPDC101160 TaxID=3366118 RepID=UPI0038023EE5